MDLDLVVIPEGNCRVQSEAVASLRVHYDCVDMGRPDKTVGKWHDGIIVETLMKNDNLLSVQQMILTYYYCET